MRIENDPDALADRLRFSGGARRPRRQGGARRPACRRRAPTSCSTPAGRCSPTSACARRSRCCSTSNGSITATSSISTGAPRAIFDGSELSAHGRPADARERALLAPFPGRGARRRARRHLVAAGQRRLRTRPHDAAARARPVRGGRLRAARHRAGRAADRQAVHLRDHGRRRATTNGSRCCSARASSAPASRRGCAPSMRCSTRRRKLVFDFDMIQNRWDQSLSPGNEQAFYWGIGRRRRSRHAQLHGRQEPRGRRHDRRAAQGAKAGRTSSPRCARSTGC